MLDGLTDLPLSLEDPVMYDLMKDPVILPTSKISIDRSTIRSHLLSDPNDPFNRTPLRIEDVIPGEFCLHGDFCVRYYGNMNRADGTQIRSSWPE